MKPYPDLLKEALLRTPEGPYTHNIAAAYRALLTRLNLWSGASAYEIEVRIAALEGGAAKEAAK